MPLPLSHPQISNSNIFTPLTTLVMVALLLTLMWLPTIEVKFSLNVSFLFKNQYVIQVLVICLNLNFLVNSSSLGIDSIVGLQVSRNLRAES
jgi:hypothetical protein